MNPSAQYSFTLRVNLATNPQTLGSAIGAIGSVGGVTGSVELVEAEPARGFETSPWKRAASSISARSWTRCSA